MTLGQIAGTTTTATIRVEIEMGGDPNLTEKPCVQETIGSLPGLRETAHSTEAPDSSKSHDQIEKGAVITATRDMVQETTLMSVRTTTVQESITTIAMHGNMKGAVQGTEARSQLEQSQ